MADPPVAVPDTLKTDCLDFVSEVSHCLHTLRTLRLGILVETTPASLISRYPPDGRPGSCLLGIIFDNRYCHKKPNCCIEG
jgi:hypothetical protein